MNTAHDRVATRPEQALVTLLEQWIGLDAQTIGNAAIARAVRVRREACGEADDKAFLARLARDAEERVRLIDEVVVPESWFFRDPQVFEFLKRFAATFATAPGQTPIRILCVPCAAGQEPYSVAMALFEAGLSASQFKIDAADVSRTVLKQAMAATYSANAFRGTDVAFRERWFHTQGTSAELVATVRTQVQVFQGNLLDASFAADCDPYDVVFCRNLLIYLTPDARRRAEQAIDRLLAPDGLLVLGAAEPPILQGRWVPAAGTSAFTLRRGTRSSEGFLAEALAMCQRHQQEFGPDAKVFFLMGMLHRFTGDLDRAEACLHKTLYLDPNHDEALLSLATVAAERGDRGMADRYRQSAARVHARNESS